MVVVVEATVLEGPAAPAAVLIEDGVEPNEKGAGFGSFEGVALDEAAGAEAVAAVAKPKEGAAEVVALAAVAVGKEKDGVEEAVEAAAVLPKDKPVEKLKEADEEGCADAEEPVPVPNKGEEEKTGVAVGVVAVEKVAAAVVEPNTDGAVDVAPKRGDEGDDDDVFNEKPVPPKMDGAGAEPKRGLEAAVVLVLVPVEEEGAAVVKPVPEPILDPKRGLEAGAVEAPAALLVVKPVPEPKRGLTAGVVEAPKRGLGLGLGLGLEAGAVDVPAPKRGLEEGAGKGEGEAVAPPKRGLEAGGTDEEVLAPKRGVVDAAAVPKRELAAGVVVVVVEAAAAPKRGVEVEAGVVEVGKRVEEEEEEAGGKEKAGAEEAAKEKAGAGAGVEEEGWKEKGEEAAVEEGDWKDKVEEEVVEGVVEEELKEKPVDAIAGDGSACGRAGGRDFVLGFWASKVGKLRRSRHPRVFV